MGKNNKSKLRRRGEKEILQKRQPSRVQGQSHDTSGSCMADFLTGCLIMMCLVAAVCAYAYATSPIRSVVVNGVHDAAAMKWNREHNSDLGKGQKLFTDLIGAESIVVDEQKNWYTGLTDGRLIKISDVGKPTEKVRDITSDVDYTANGGRSLKRPLGMRIFEKKLYFADSYQGIFAMNLKTLSWEKIVGFNQVSPPLHYTNDLTISKDGVIYFIDACGRWTYDNTIYSVAEGRCTGRLFRIGSDGKDLQLLKDKLCFPNGVELTRDETKILVSEFARHNILVVDLNTLATVKTVYLHGGGDNIRRSLTGGYWVPIPALGHPTERFLNRFPFIKDIVMKFLRPEHIAKVVNTQQGTILKLNEELEIEKIHQDLEGKVAWAITQVQEYEPGKLLLGSFAAPGIVQLDLPLSQKKVN